jgi:hypothetical protein
MECEPRPAVRSEALCGVCVLLARILDGQSRTQDLAVFGLGRAAMLGSANT